MAVFAALFKGVNVGGKNLVKMDELRRLFESLGLKGARTYIQSGNILFKSGADKAALYEKITRGFAEAFGFSAPFVLRTAGELEAALHAFPFEEEGEATVGVPKTLYTAFLSGAPSAKSIALLNKSRNEKEEFALLGQDIHLRLPEGIRKSKLAGHLQLLDVSATIRNVGTLAALVSLAESMKD